MCRVALVDAREVHDAESGGTHEFKCWIGLDSSLRVLGECDSAIDGKGKRVHAVGAHCEP